MSTERHKPSRGRGFYEWLVYTEAKDPVGRVDGRLLALALLVVLALVAVSVPLMLFEAVRPEVRLAISVPAAFGILALSTAFLINRSGRGDLAAHTFVLSVAVFSAVYLGFNPTSAFSGNAWMLIPVIVAAFFLGTVWTLVYGGLVFLALLGGILLGGGTVLQVEQSVVGMLLPALLVLLLARGRDLNRQQMQATSDQLRQQQANLEAVFRATPDAVLTVGLDGRVTQANGPAHRLAKRMGAQDVVEGRPVVEVLPGPLAHKVREQFSRVISGGRYLDELAFSSPTAGGEEETCEVVLAPVRDSSGISGALLQVRDTTRLRRKERETATKLQEAKRAILNMAAHELNTPMTPILIELRALEARFGADSTNLPAINRIRRNLDRLSDSIDQIVDLALAKEGSLPLRLEPVAFGEVVDEALQRLDANFKEKGLYLQVDGGTGPTLYIDHARVRRALMNILENAAENSPRGKTVFVSWYELRGGQVLCKVRDEGVGFQPGLEPTMFESFQALRDTSVGGGKPGLGLAMSKAIIEAHGGMIGASTEGPGHGAQFSFVLPVDARRGRMGVTGSDRHREARQREVPVPPPAEVQGHGVQGDPPRRQERPPQAMTSSSARGQS